MNMKEFHKLYLLANAGLDDDRVNIQHYISCLIFMQQFINYFYTFGGGLPSSLIKLEGMK